MTGPSLTALVQTLPATVPFVGPETKERARGAGFAARLGANENVFGPSPKAVAAMQAATADVWMYGDPESFDLKAALAAHHFVEPQNIAIGEGIDGLLGYLARMLISPGDTVVTSLGAYPTFNYHVVGYGGQLDCVPYRDDREDPRALVARAAEIGSRLIYFANPDNPMGTWHDADTVTSVINDIRDDTLLILDEAYVEFAPDGTAPPLDVSDPRVIRFRTFSKAYGMAGARVGYAIGHADLLGQFNKLRNHFGVPRVSQIGAFAALADKPHLDKTIADVAQARQRIAAIARDCGLTSLPSATNFVAVDCGRDDTFAARVLAGLIDRDIFVRMPFVAPQNRCVRISAGRPTDLDLLEAALPDTLKEARHD